jgi:hypothetical protein
MLSVIRENVNLYAMMSAPYPPPALRPILTGPGLNVFMRLMSLRGLSPSFRRGLLTTFFYHVPGVTVLRRCALTTEGHERRPTCESLRVSAGRVSGAGG